MHAFSFYCVAIVEWQTAVGTEQHMVYPHRHWENYVGFPKAENNETRHVEATKNLK